MDTIILFDMDGTLIDSTDAIYKSFSKVFIDNNMPELSKKEVSKFIGYTLNDMFKFFGAKEECIPRYCDEYKSHYIKICNQYTHLITNARDSIILASSFAHLGIVTTKSSRSSKELLARIKVQLRKKEEKKNSELKYKDMVLENNSHTLHINDKKVNLTKTDYAILKQLLLTPNQVITKTHLLDLISEDTPDCDENSLKVHISNLRKKIKSVTDEEYIESVWGIGFKLFD